MDRVDEAIETYKKGLEVDPNDATLQKDLKAAEQKKSSGAGMGAGAGAGMGAGGMNPAYLQAMLKLMQHPETKELFQDPNFMQSLQAIMANPALAQVYMQQDPRFKKVFDILSQETNPDDLANMEKMFANQGGFGGSGPSAEQK